MFVELYPLHVIKQIDCFASLNYLLSFRLLDFTNIQNIAKYSLWNQQISHVKYVIT